jgi:hypothetical protein
MTDEIERVYSTLITRVVRNPRSPFQSHLSPILIVVPDFPVRKRHKEPLNDPTINDGLHMHGILLMPPNSRLKQNVVSHFNQHKSLYVKNRLHELDVEPIVSNLPRVVDYAFKSVKKGKVDLDDILIFPKADGELRRFEGKRRVVDEKPDPTLPEIPADAEIAPQHAPASRKRPREYAEDYPYVVAVLDAKTRVIECADGIQWIVQRRTGSLKYPWAGRSFCRTKEALLRIAGRHPALEALPEICGEGLTSLVEGRGVEVNHQRERGEQAPAWPLTERGQQVYHRDLRSDERHEVHGRPST